MKKLSLIFSGILLVFSVAFSVAGENIVKEERKLNEFSRINIGLAGEVFLKQGTTQKFELEGEPAILEEIETVVSEGQLKVKYKKQFFSAFRNSSKVRIYITVKEVNELNISGSAGLIAEYAVQTGDLTLIISGSGKITFNDILANRIKTTISGSGSVKLIGTKSVKEQIVKISGSGSLNSVNLKCENAFINISGSGNCRIHATNLLEAHISGSGIVSYSGKPKIDAKISGSGKVISAR